MSFASWFQAHTLGSSVFVPTVAVLSGAAEFANRRQRRELLPWLLLGLWTTAVAIHYFMLGIGRFLGYARLFWLAQVADLAIVSAIPLGLATLPFVLPSARTFKPGVRVAISLVLGLAGILIVSPVSAILGRAVIPLIITGDA